MSPSLKQTLLFSSALVLISALLTIAAPAKWLYQSDSMNKLIQAYSLLNNDFQSEELYYRGKEIDPDYSHYPYQGIWLLEVNGRYLGQYPVAFSALIAPFLWLAGPDYLNFISILLGASLALLLLRWGASAKQAALALVASYAMILGVDLSENTVFLLLLFGGYTWFMRRAPEASAYVPFIAGVLAGSSIFFRLEGLLFALSMGIAYLLLLAHGIRSKHARDQFKPFLVFGIGFVVATLAFFAFNQWDYGHILGPRFLKTEEGYGASLFERLRRAGVLLFFGNQGIGFFLFMPYVLIALLLGLARRIRQHLSFFQYWNYLTVCFYLLLAASLAPNDGVANIGPRYLAPAIGPGILAFLHIRKLAQEHIPRPRIQRVIWNILIGVAVLVSALGVAIGVGAAGFNKRIIQELDKCETTINVYADPALGNFIGTSYFQNHHFVMHPGESEESLAHRILDDEICSKSSCKITVYDLPPGHKEREAKSLSLMAKARFLAEELADINLEEVGIERKSFIEILSQSGWSISAVNEGQFATCTTYDGRN